MCFEKSYIQRLCDLMFVTICDLCFVIPCWEELKIYIYGSNVCDSLVAMRFSICCVSFFSPKNHTENLSPSDIPTITS